MSDLDTIQEVRVVASIEGDQDVIRSAGQLGAAIDGVVVKTDNLSKAQLSAQRQLEATAKKYDAEYRAVSELAKVQALLERARAQGLSGTEAFARAQEVVTARLQAQSAAAKVANDNLLRLQATASAQRSINVATGVQTDFNTDARAADIAAYAAELDRLREKFVPVFAAQQQYARQQAEITDALKVGAISANEAAAAQMRLTAAYQDQTQKLERLAQTQKEAAQRAVNSQLIVPDRGGDIAAFAAEMDKLQAKFDPLFRAEQAYIKTVEELDRALAVGAVSQEVYNARVAEQGEILDAAVAKINGTAEAQERAAQAVKTAATAQEEYNRLLGVRTDFNTAGRAADIEAYGQALNATRAKYDPLFAAQQQYLGGLRDLRAALAAGAIDQDVFARNLAAQKQAFAEQVNGLGLYSRAQREAAAAAQATAQVVQDAANKARAQGAVNAQTIVPNRVEDVAAYGQALDELRAKFNPLFAAEQQLLAIENEISNAAKVGAISEKERSAALSTARARFLDQTNEIRKSEEANARLTKGVGLNAYAWQNLSYQVNDVVTSLAAGISPFQTLAQQGGQIYQILQSGQGGVGGALAGIRDRLLAINPLVGVFGLMAAGAVAAAVAVYSVAKANRDVELALLGAGKGAGVSADQIADIAIRAAKTADITVGAAREIETAFLRAGKVYGEIFLQGTVAAANFGKASGQDNAKAAEFVAQSLSTLGSGGYEELAKKAGNFDAKLEDQVRTLLNTGREMEAQQLVVERFGQAFDKAGEKLTTFDRIMAGLKSGASSLIDSLGRGLSGVVEPAEQLSRVEAAIKTRRAIAEASGTTADTSDLDARAARIQAALKQTGDVAEREAKRVRQNADAQAKAATSAIVPEIASIEKIRQQREEANKALNALEATGGSTERIEAAKKAVSAAAEAERDYANAGGAANIERVKAENLLRAGLQAMQARTPEAKAEAARQQALAETFGTVTSAAERTARANDAYRKSTAESRQASIDQTRTMGESTKTANELADANVKTGKSVEYLAAQRKVDEQIAAGTIDKVERETKIREQLQSQLSEVNKQTAERIRSARDQTAVQGGLNDKVAAGTMVSAEAARRLASETELAKLSREADAASGEEKARLTQRVQELRAATEAQLSAEDRTRVLSMSEDEQRRIDLLTKEAGLLGETARERQKALIVLQAEQDLKKQGISLTAPESVAYLDKVKLRADLDTAKTEYERLAQDISSAVSGIFDDMFKAGNKGISGLADSFSKGFSRIGTRLLEQNIIAPLIGGQGLNGQSGGGLFSGLASMFNGEKVEKAVSAGSETGIFAGLTNFLKPKSSGASNGAFAQSGLGQGLLAAGVGASIGYQSRSLVGGLIGGGLTGLAVGGPIGGIVGAIGGAVGDLLGESQAKKEAKKKLQQEIAARKEALEQARPQIEALAITFEGGSQGNVGKQIADAFAQMKQANKVASEGGDQALADKLVKDFQAYVARMVAVYADGFEGTRREIEQGFGMNGPFASALSAVQQLGEALKGFVADSGRLSDPAAVQRAREAAVEGALSSLDAPKTLSATGTEFARIQGTAAGLNQVLKDLGFSADQTAQIIADRTTKAVDALREKFDTDLDRKINDAQGKSYLNDTADLLKEVAGLRVDAGQVGGDLGKVETYFGAAAQKIVDSGQLTGDAFAALTQQFPELTGLVHEYSAALTDSATALAAIAERRAGFQDRYFAATTDTSTQAGALAAFERTAEKDRAAEVKAGGEALADLEKAQGAERAAIVKQFADQAAEAERQTLEATASRVKGYGDRLFAATNDATTLAGQLAAYDRQADADRAEEAKAGGQGLADLERAQAAERLKIVDDFGKQAAEALAARLSGYGDRLFAATNDAASLAGQLAAYDRQAEKDRAAEVKAGGQALVELEGVQAVERAAIVKAANDAALERARGFNDRIFAATNDDTTLAGKLAAFDRQAAAERTAEVAAGGQAIADLEAAQGAERLKIITDFATQATQAIRERMAGFSDREFAAINDSTSLRAQLLAFDRTADQQRLAEAAAGGGAMAGLERTLSAERMKIFTDAVAQATDAAAQAAEQAVSDARSQLEAAYQAESSALQTTISRLESFTKSIRTFRESLVLNASLSPLSAQERLNEAQRQFRETAALAQSGDADAQDRLQGVSQTYLEEAKSFYASTEDYYRAFSEVQSILQQTEAKAQSDLDLSRQQLTALNAQVSGLITIDKSVKTVAQAIGDLKTMLAAQAAASALAGSKSTESSNAAFLTQAYQQLLGRAPDAGGLAEFSNRLNAGVSRSDIIGEITKSPEYVLNGIYQSTLGRNVDSLGYAKYSADLAAGRSTADIIAEIRQSAEYAARGMLTGGLVGAYATGGMVGNGLWNVDSVLARYAGGGNIALAGGEYVTRAPMVTPATMPVLEAINAGTFRPSNDGGQTLTRADLREALAEHGKMVRAALREQTGDLSKKLDEGTDETRKAATDARIAGQKAA